MPASANVASGKSSVWIRVEVSIRRSRALPATTAAWATNAPPPTSTERSASSSIDSSPSTSSVPCRNSAGPSIASAPAAVSSLTCRPPATTRHERGDEADQGDPELGTPPARLRHERLDEHAEAGGAEHDQDRQQPASTTIDGAGWSPPPSSTGVTAASVLRAGRDGRGRVGLPGVVHGAGHRRVDHVEHRLRVDAQEQDQRDQRRDRQGLAAGQVPEPAGWPARAAARAWCAGTAAGCRARPG